MRKVLSIILSLIMVLTTLPLMRTNSFALTDGDWEYTLNNNEATVTGYTGSLTNLVIPSTLGGYTVTAVGNNAFQGNTTLETITLPSACNTINDYAFQGCSSLTTINYNNSPLQTIGKHAFDRCTSLTSVNIPNSVITLDECAFDYCTGVTDIVIGNGVTLVGYGCFGSNPSLINVTLGNSVQTIAAHAFGACTNLEKINIPASVTAIGEYAFTKDNKVETYITDVAAWCSINFNSGKGYYSNPVELGHKLYINGVEAEDIVIPSGITAISAGAFDGCESVKSIVIPEGVTTINKIAFRNCINLESITIPSTLTTISNQDTFYQCNSLNTVKICDLEAWCDISFESENANPLFLAHNLYINGINSTVTLPNTLTTVKSYSFAGLANDVIIPSNVMTVGAYAFYKSTSAHITLNEGLQIIGNYAFANNTGLLSIDLPDTLTTIGIYAFNECTALKNVEIGTGLTSINNYDFNKCSSLQTLTIPANIETIGKHSFDRCSSLTSITIPDTVITLDEYAFDYCTGVSDIVIGNGVTSIGYGCFGSNPSLINVTLGNSVQTIGAHAFGTCINLEKINIPASVTSIGGYAFENNNEFEIHITDLAAWCRIQFNGTTGQYYSNPTENGHKLYLNGELITDLVIPDTVTGISSGAFDRCTYIESVTIPDSVTSIGKYAFRGSNNIETIIIGSGVTSIGDNAFTECTGLQEVHIDNVAAWCNINFSNLDSNPLTLAHDLYVNDVYSTVTVPNTVTELKQYVFTNISNPVVVSGSVESIRYRAFYKSTTQSVTLNEGLKTIDNEAFSLSNNLLSIDLPDSLTSIGTYVFNECRSLKDVEIGTGLTKINSYDFNKCSAIEELTIPANIVTICNNAFDYCSAISSLTLNEGLVTIGTAAFGTNTSLKSVTIPDTVTTLSTAAFGTCTSLESIYIPNSVTNISSYAFEKNNPFETHITDLAAWCNIAFNGTAGQYYSNPLECGHYLYINDVEATDLRIPKGVTSISQGAFDGCYSTRIIRIPEGVNEIKNYTFRNNINLTDLVIPRSVTNINSGAFNGCNSIGRIYCYIGSYADSYYTNAAIKKYLGDMNNDGVVDAFDIDIVISVASGNTDLNDDVLEIVADYNLDGVIDGFDAAEMDRDAYGHTSAKGDINEDGEINATDYAMVKEYVQCTTNLLDKSNLTAEYDGFKDNYDNGVIITQQYYRADYDGDKSVDAFDLYYLDSRINSLI